MAHLLLSLFIEILFTNNTMLNSTATVNLSDLYNKNWRMDQLYIDSVRYENTVAAALIYNFRSSGSFSLANSLSASVSYGTWSYNPSTSTLQLNYRVENNRIMTIGYQIIYLDCKTLVWRAKEWAPEKGRNIFVEYRLTTGNASAK
jgi:hypothetical protein